MSTVSGLGSGWGNPRLQLGHSDPALIRIQRLGSMEEDMEQIWNFRLYGGNTVVRVQGM